MWLIYIFIYLSNQNNQIIMDSFFNYISVRVEGYEVDVLLYSDSTDENDSVVIMRSMINEWHLVDEIGFSDRDGAYDFINNCNKAIAKAFIIRVGYQVGAFE